MLHKAVKTIPEFSLKLEVEIAPIEVIRRYLSGVEVEVIESSLDNTFHHRQFRLLLFNQK